MMSIVSAAFLVSTGEFSYTILLTNGSLRNQNPCSQQYCRGVWALIQAQISQIDFDYASYAELRLGEYWAWKHEVDGSRKKAGQELPLREQRWVQDA